MSPLRSSAEVQRELRHLDGVAQLMDAKFRIPGTRFRFGYDSLIGLIPGLGDTVAVAPAIYLLYRARRFGVPARVMLRMCANVGVDYLAGLVPVVGDLFDAAFKANLRNTRLLRDAIRREYPDAAAQPEPKVLQDVKVW